MSSLIRIAPFVLVGVVSLFYSFSLDATIAFYVLNVVALGMGLAILLLGAKLLKRENQGVGFGITCFVSGMLMAIVHVIKLMAGAIV